MLGQTLKVTQDTGNLQYYFAIFLGAKVLGKLTDFDAARHASGNKLFLPLLVKLSR